ncbi:hypothetical protein GCM10029992_00760 [Glycomyces albus]
MFVGVEAGREHVERIVLEVGIEVGIGAVVGAPASVRAGVLGHVGGGGLVSVVVDDECLSGAGLGDRPAGGVDPTVVEPTQKDQVLGDRFAPFAQWRR